jgi:hypothetical protein
MTPDEKKLLQVFRAMSPDQQTALQDYADFLVARDKTASPVAEAAAALAEPVDIPRPEEESVIDAVRRLSETYPMIDKEVLLHETTDLVSQHFTQGRPAEEVIDELQALFEKHYRSLKG